MCHHNSRDIVFTPKFIKEIQTMRRLTANEECLIVVYVDRLLSVAISLTP